MTDWLTDNAQPKLLNARSLNLACVFVRGCRGAIREDFAKFLREREKSVHYTYDVTGDSKLHIKHIKVYYYKMTLLMD